MINNKFSIGDEVFFMYEDNIRKGNIFYIQITIDENSLQKETYTLKFKFHGDNQRKSFLSEDLFRSLDSLVQKQIKNLEEEGEIFEN